MPGIDTILRAMDTIPLEEMERVKLMNRVDSKYPTNMQTLLSMAPLWKDNFLVQTSAGRLVASYRSLYFDTDDAITYTVHHNRHLRRQKVRQRIYVDSQTAFCEVKNKKNTGRTKKKRIQIPLDCWGDLHSLPAMEEFLKERVWITDRAMSPRLENAFSRITLVNKAMTERVTIDFGITFRNHLHGHCASVDNLVIIEVKQDGARRSEFKDILLGARVKRKGLSKYCLGMLLTDPSVKYNRFKEKVRYVNKLTGIDNTIKAAQI
ncbi:MAG: polyphosphate polymerase domain-containing protein [Bacteroidales bacterium]|nr:polyphosphate polymerase domain-containing protein [Bacteroidales bacterium]